ncbi:hypothetical protein ACJQ40_002747 [Enterococcus faecium]
MTERKEALQSIPEVNQENQLLNETFIPAREDPQIQVTEPIITNTYHFRKEINYTFEEVKRDTEEFLQNAITQEENSVNNIDLKNILDEHMNKVESVIRQCMESLDAKNKFTQEEVQKETTKMKKSIGTILSDFKKNVQNYITNQKNKVTSQVRSTKEDIISGFRSYYTRRMLTINSQLKKLTMKIDQKLSVEAGQEKTEEKLQNNQEETVQTTSKENPDTEQKKTMNKKIEIKQNVELEKIEQLSKQLGIKVTDKERQSIVNLSEKQKVTLIESLKNEVEKSKEESTTKEDVELEIG